jgi:hypothetical protein
MYVYIASPIDNSNATTSEARAAARSHLLNAGISIYDPAKAFSVPQGAQPSPEIQDVNESALEHATAVLVMLPEHTRTVGTVLELAQALRTKKLVVIWAPNFQHSVVMANIKIKTHDTVEAAVAQLVELLP